MVVYFWLMYMACVNMQTPWRYAGILLTICSVFSQYFNTTAGGATPYADFCPIFEVRAVQVGTIDPVYGTTVIVPVATDCVCCIASYCAALHDV